MNADIVQQSNIHDSKDQNPQLKQPPLQIQMDPTKVASSKIKSVQTLQKLLNNCMTKIEEMIQIANTNQRLEKYFKKAGTDSKQILFCLKKLQQDLMIFKERLNMNNTNFIIIGDVLQFMDQILNQNNLNTMKNIQKAIWIVQFQSKVICSMEFIMQSLTLPYDITTMNKQCFQEVWEKIMFQKLGKEQKIKDGLLFTKKMMAITTSAVLDQEKRVLGISKIMSFGLSYPHYFFSDKEGQLKSMFFYRKPTIEMASKIWNLPQNGMTRQLAKLGMKSITSNFKIYIPINQSKQPKDLLHDDGQSIQVRVLHNDQIFLKNTKKSRFSLCSVDQQQNDRHIQQVILHMHGGGFVALSSRSMQVYTRKWARDLKIPVFSIDYRMPPHHRFPIAVTDCLKVYKFLIQKIDQYFNIRPKKIIIAGDSAGGNLAFTLTALIMKQKLSIPYGIFTAYPACDMRKKFSPSKLYAFTDPLLNPPMLLLCLKQYLSGQQQNQLNPLASPVLLTEQFVGGQKGDKRFPLQWPRTIIQVGAIDPLYDDSLKIMERMVSSKINCQCHVYENLSHGFLNLQFVIPDCQKTIKDSIKHLGKLLK